MTTVSLPAAIGEVAARDPVMAHLVSLAGPIRHRPRNPDGPFGALVRAIVFQQLAGAAARAIHQRVRATVAGDLTPEALTEVSDEQLRAAGLSGAKLASIRDLSAKVLAGTVVLDRSPRLSDDEIVSRLTTVRGIGRWTAEMYLIFELRRLDVWPVDDLGVREGYGLAWGLRPSPRARELAPLGERFRPYRSIVARYCWLTGAPPSPSSRPCAPAIPRHVHRRGLFPQPADADAVHDAAAAVQVDGGDLAGVQDGVVQRKDSDGRAQSDP